MATRGGENEPSMEDILASIRRIIADDQSDGPPSPGRAPREEERESEQRAAQEMRWRSLDEIEEEGDAADAEEPYDLTEEVTEDTAGRRWYDEPDEPEATYGGTAPAYTTQDDSPVPGSGDDVLELRAEDEVLELTEEVEEEPIAAPELPLGPALTSDDGAAGDGPPLPEGEIPLELTPEMEITDEAEADMTTRAATPGGHADEQADESAMPMNGMFREGQRGSQPSPAVAHAFTRLRQTMASENGRRNEQRADSAAGQPELQANLEQLLRPMIKEWLDENLPQAVERLVREEVSRVAKDPEND